MTTSLRDLVDSGRTKSSASGPYGGNRSISSGSISLSMGELVRDHNDHMRQRDDDSDDDDSDDGSYSTNDYGNGRNPTGRNNNNNYEEDSVPYSLPQSSFGAPSSSNGFSNSFSVGDSTNSRGRASTDIFDDEGDVSDSQTSASQQESDTNKTSDLENADENLETQRICGLTLFIKLTLIILTGFTAATIYINLTWEENEQFTNLFQDQALNTIDKLRTQFQHTLRALDDFGVQYTSQARISRSQWPFVSLPDQHYRGPSNKFLTETHYVSFVPIVTKDKRVEWEKYTLGPTASSWINDGIINQQQSSSSSSSSTTATTSEQRTNIFAQESRNNNININSRSRQLSAREQREYDAENGKQNENGPRPTPPPTPPPTIVNTDNEPTAQASTAPTPTPTPSTSVIISPDPTPPPSGQKNGSENIQKPQYPVQPPPTGGGGGGEPPSPSPPPTNNNNNPLPPPTLMPVENVQQLESGDPVQYLDNGVATTAYRIDHQSSSSSLSTTPVVQDYSKDFILPIWQSTPVIPKLIKFDLRSHANFGPEIEAATSSISIVVGKTILFPSTTTTTTTEDTFLYNYQTEIGNSSTGDDSSSSSSSIPMCQLYVPVYSDFQQEQQQGGTTTGQVSGVITAIISWQQYLTSNLPSSEFEPIICVLENSLGQTFSFQVNGQGQTDYLGEGDYHDPIFDEMEVALDFTTPATITTPPNNDKDDENVNSNTTATTKFLSTYSGSPLNTNYNRYNLRIYPTMEMQSQYITNKPLLYTLAVIFTFMFTVLMIAFLSYLNHRRYRRVLKTAKESSAVVSSLFPAVVRERLFQGKSERTLKPASAKRRLKSFLDEGKKSKNIKSKPIADLFPYTTVMFGDIAGFTAWSSVREPSQVFTLLETIYHAFDSTAKKRKVFKVETIGDCYVAVTGLPDPQNDHAVIMAKFSMECMAKFNDLTEKLELTLGPDTGDLSMRFGLHSGPVTAGVLRGDKSRFQLFGDTVNTAARMESTGEADHIQCSQSTADLLISGGKAHWLTPREDTVQAKGKGTMQTFWIDPEARFTDPLSESGGFHSGRSLKTSARDLKDIAMSTKSLVWGEANNFVGLGIPNAIEAHKYQRLIDWNVDLLKGLLKQVIAKRARWDSSRLLISSIPNLNYQAMTPSATPRSQVTEIIVMPEFDPKVAKQLSPNSIDLNSAVLGQLKRYVTEIASLYHDDNPFHNFEHASHVTMSANKLLQRVVSPDDVYDRNDSKRKRLSNLHEYTFGITSDPLTQFAIVFSALVHDVDHSGVSNGQLVKETSHEAVKYSGKSVAENNSVDLSWSLLMRPEYEDLQKSIWSNEIEFRRFRQLVVNSVIATDIFDKDLKDLRNQRWNKAFHENIEDPNLKATIVIEHIIQAADVSHTMQHWHIYQKWNERLFKEMYQAFRSGRGGEKDPSDGWYKGELWFYDNYVIPLAKKLNECGVFGVASAECLSYAEANRSEWAANGEEIVERMKEDNIVPKWAQSDSSFGSTSVSISE